MDYPTYREKDYQIGSWVKQVHADEICDDGDGIREVHINTIEGLWTGLRNFLRPFRGVSKHFFSGYVAIHEFRINLKRITVAFISNLVRTHSFYP